MKAFDTIDWNLHDFEVIEDWVELLKEGLPGAIRFRELILGLRIKWLEKK